MKKFLLISTAMVALSSTPTKADPISLAVAAASTATAASGGTLISFGLTGLSTFSALAVDFAVRATLGYALNTLASKPTPLNSQNAGYRNVNSLGASLPHQIIYGKTRVGGAVFYQNLSNSSQSLHRCIAFAGHEVDSFEKIYFNDKEVTIDTDGSILTPPEFAGKGAVFEHLGAEDQTADASLVTTFSEWTEDHRAQGIAYLHVRFDLASNYPNGIPTVTAEIKGKEVLDPRNADPAAWSANPALCIRDYLLADYGLEEVSTNIDDTLFESAADTCDELVSGVAQYTCNGSFTLDTSPEDIIRVMLSSMGGIFWNYGGKWAVQPAVYREPVASFDESDLRSGLQIATRHSRRDNFNAVRGQYRGPANDYQPVDYDEIITGLYLAEDNYIKTLSELDLVFTDTNNMAQRIARTFLRRNREQTTVVASFGISAIDIKIGDNIQLSVDHMGWVDKVFEVVDWRMSLSDNNIVINMILRENSEEVYVGKLDTLTDESGVDLFDESGNDLEAIIN